MENSWDVRSRYRMGGSDPARWAAVPLRLDWWVEGAEGLVSNAEPDAPSDDLFLRWAQGKDERVLPIRWAIASPAAGLYENAPFCGTDQDFLDHYSLPTHAVTGARLRFTQLPVLDQSWERKTAGTCGFIQDATGWKPSPLQQSMDVGVILQSCGIGRTAVTP